ncbi:MAG: ABC transporter permease [bacterium]
MALVNWIGFGTLLWKEIKRFLKVFGQTVVSPIITTLLYLIVFGFSLGNRIPTHAGVGYVDFLVPGLVMLIIINNAFMNTTSSLFISKLQGTLIDLLVAPISNGAVLVAYVLAAVLRSLICAAGVVAMAWLVSGVGMRFPLQVLGYAILVAVAFALLGFGTAIISDKFEQLNVVLTFVITPLTFLGGVFYSIDLLPEPWHTISLFNPILYMINGFRHGFVGVSDVSPLFGIAFVIGSCVVLTCWNFWLLTNSKKLRP